MLAGSAGSTTIPASTGTMSTEGVTNMTELTEPTTQGDNGDGNHGDHVMTSYVLLITALLMAAVTL